MNVGILSMQRIPNYGSFLQAYALKEIMEELGGEVYFIDIKKGTQIKYPKHSEKKISKTAKLIQSILNGKMGALIQSSLYHKKREKKFVNDFIPMLYQKKNNPEKYDLVIIGSDEVFNACQDTSYGFSPQLYGQGIPASKMVSYAGSFGFTTMEDIVRNMIDQPIKDALKNLTKISVRDQNSFDIISKLVGVEPLMHLDPVLIFNWEEYLNKKQIKGKYLLVYTYHNRISDTEKKVIIGYAKKNALRLVSFNSYYDWCDQSIIPKSPFDVLNYFKCASEIVTDTFHGSIFSVITKSNFCTIVRESNKNKVGFLLSMLGQSDRMVENCEDIKNKLSVVPDYCETERIISYQRDITYKYLKECI